MLQQFNLLHKQNLQQIQLQQLQQHHQNHQVQLSQLSPQTNHAKPQQNTQMNSQAKLQAHFIQQQQQILLKKQLYAMNNLKIVRLNFKYLNKKNYLITI